jgi:hypothetical protein
MSENSNAFRRPDLILVKGNKPTHCEHCSSSKELEEAPAWRRRGKIIERVWPDGRRELACHFCGRAVSK